MTEIRNHIDYITDLLFSDSEDVVNQSLHHQLFIISVIQTFKIDNLTEGGNEYFQDHLETEFHKRELECRFWNQCPTSEERGKQRGVPYKEGGKSVNV